jgi:hypothetical protein
LVSTEPVAAITAGEVKFSLAINWMPVVWRSTSRSMRVITSVSGSVSEGKGIGGPWVRLTNRHTVPGQT